MRYKHSKIFIAMLILWELTLPFMTTSQVQAASKDDLVKRKQELDKQQQQFQSTISQLRKNTASLKNELLIYQNQIQSTEIAIESQKTQIEDANGQISELQDEIKHRQDDIEQNKQIVSELVRQLYELNANSAIVLTLSSDNFSDFLDNVNNTQEVHSKVYDVLQTIKDIKSKLEIQQADLQNKVKELENLKEQNEETQNSLEGQRHDKQSLLDKTKGQESQYQKLLAASQKEEADIDKEIEELNKQAQASGKGGGIKPSKGALAWPMDGKVSQGYGNTGFTSLGYSFHNGLDIAAPAGTPIYAPADGTIVQCRNDSTAYGNWCALKSSVKTKEGNKEIVTLFGHMRSIKAKTGDKLSLGDIIGYEGNTGTTTRLIYGPERGYHLHFTVFDSDGFKIVPGAHPNIYGPYGIPTGFTYDPRNFLE